MIDASVELMRLLALSAFDAPEPILDVADAAAHAVAPDETCASAAGALCNRALLMPASLVRFSISGLIATMRVLPDIDSATISGLSTNGYKTPAARGNAITL